jgi:3-oxoacyl-[acyl-carrier-protein] synthase-1
VPGEVVVVGCGMMTPVGVSAAETSASARSRTARQTEIRWLDSRFKPFVVGAVPDDGLPDLHPELASLPLSYREARMLRLSEISMQQAMGAYPKGGSAVSLLLGLPEHETTVPLKPREFLTRLVKQCKLPLNVGTRKRWTD